MKNLIFSTLFVGGFLWLFLLERRMRTMASNVERIKAAADAIVEDAATVKQVVTDLKGLVKTLSDQVAAGQVDQQTLADAATRLEQADADIDSTTAADTQTT